jgi:hypothetical protein
LCVSVGECEGVCDVGMRSSGAGAQRSAPQRRAVVRPGAARKHAARCGIAAAATNAPLVAGVTTNTVVAAAAAEGAEARRGAAQRCAAGRRSRVSRGARSGCGDTHVSHSGSRAVPPQRRAHLSRAARARRRRAAAPSAWWRARCARENTHTRTRPLAWCAPRRNEGASAHGRRLHRPRARHAWRRTLAPPAARRTRPPRRRRRRRCTWLRGAARAVAVSSGGAASARGSQTRVHKKRRRQGAPRTRGMLRVTHRTAVAAAPC